MQGRRSKTKKILRETIQDVKDDVTVFTGKENIYKESQK